MTFTFVIPQNPNTSDFYSIKTNYRKVFIEGDTIDFDVEILKDDVFFDVSLWSATAELISGTRMLVGIFNVYKFVEDKNRLRLNANYEPLLALTKGFYSPITESGDYYIYVKLKQQAIVKTILPLAIYLKRKSHD